MRAIVIGGSGQIGGWLLHTLANRGHDAIGTYATVPTPGLTRLDASEYDASASWVKAQQPDVIFYPAGFTWVDGCERDPARAHAANLEQPLNLARAAAQSGARFVYFSTDYVFDGLHGPYDEAAPVHPLSAYGISKLEAERTLAHDLGVLQLTLRTSWVYGPERQGKNFAYQLVRSLKQGEQLTCSSDQISSPSYGPDVALAAVLLAESGASGLFHVAGPEVIDRVAFARTLAEGFGLDPALIKGRPTAEIGQGAPRPLQGGLLTSRLNALGLLDMRAMESAVADFRIRTTNGVEGWRNPLQDGF